MKSTYKQIRIDTTGGLCRRDLENKIEESAWNKCFYENMKKIEVKIMDFVLAVPTHLHRKTRTEDEINIPTD
jgi:hypothetical protein